MKTKYNMHILLLMLFTSFIAFAQEDIFTAARTNNVKLLNKLLVEDINRADERGSTALIIACYNDNFEAAELLLKKGANPNIQDKMGNTALMGVCFKRLDKMVQLLLSYKTTINQRNYNGATALIFAATFGTDSIIKILLDKGADKTIQDRFSKTAFDYAILQENEIAVQLLK
ncbi:ankyrin repeat domain-containing protein [Flavobacterium sp. PS2]|uniref:ankyrin repeat domain-containing protein n=1 Tax=Flavobacterium sp. PS2 TaxID=3384157 RepID=UPI00390C60BC